MYIPSYVVLNGNTGNDPEQFGKGETTCASFRMAVSGGKDKPSIWLDVTCFGVTAEGVLADVAKGSKLIVTGRLAQDEWEDKETGAKRTKIKVIADEVAVKAFAEEPF